MRYLFLSILTGFLLILSFPYPDLGFLAFFALIPLLILSYWLSTGKAFLCGWLSGVIFLGGISYWLSIYGLVPFLLLIFSLGSILGIFTAGATLITRRFSLTFRLLFLPSLFISLEFLRSEMGSWCFPYGVLGYSQHNFLPFIQLASLLGVYGISFFIVLVNVILTEIILRLVDYISPSMKEKRRFFSGADSTSLDDLKKSLMALGLIILLFLVIIGYGLMNLSRSKADSSVGSFKAAVIQVSIPQKLKWLKREKKKIMRKYEKTIRKAASFKPQLIILPEAALPAYVEADDPLLLRAKNWARKIKIPLLVGVPFIGKDNKSYNTAQLFSKEGRVIDKYAKIYPVPFGEFVPLRPLTERLWKAATVRGDVEPGREVTIFRINLQPDNLNFRNGSLQRQLKFGVLICSESSSATLAWRMVKAGAELLFVITNDAWFLRTAEAEQHFNMGKFRAIENGRFLVQAANSGISGFVTPEGKVLEKSKLFEIIVLKGKVPSYKNKTFYTRYGYIFPYLAILVSLSSLLILLFKPAAQQVN